MRHIKKLGRHGEEFIRSGGAGMKIVYSQSSITRVAPQLHKFEKMKERSDKGKLISLEYESETNNELLHSKLA